MRNYSVCMNNFRRTAVLKKNMNCKLNLHSLKDSTEKN